VIERHAVAGQRWHGGARAGNAAGPVAGVMQITSAPRTSPGAAAAPTFPLPAAIISPMTAPALQQISVSLSPAKIPGSARGNRVQELDEA
jgi:hypothetical protein